MALDQLPPEAADYLSYKSIEQGRAQSTVSSYRLDLNAYCAFLRQQQFDLVSVPAQVIIDYVRTQQDLDLAHASIARSFAAIRGLHQYMATEGLRPDNPTDQVELPVVPHGLPKLLSEIEVRTLLAAVKGINPTAKRDRAMLEMLYGAGLRVSELTGLSLDDLDLSNRSIRVTGKGSKERIIPIGTMALGSLEHWLEPVARGAMEPEKWESKDDAAAVFLGRFGARLTRQSAWQMVKKHGTAAGFGARLSPHTLRHCYATHMMNRGADVRALQELLGHASVGTTQIYTHVSKSRLREVYDSSHPRALG